MTSKRLITILLCLLMVTSVAAPITASAYSWSGTKTFSLTKGDSWKSSSSASDKKESESNIVRVKTVSLTMYNNPSFRIVSSTGITPTVYCNSFKMGNTGNTKSDSHNTAPKNKTVYASLKPSSLQTGTDTIKFTFSAD